MEYNMVNIKVLSFRSRNHICCCRWLLRSMTASDDVVVERMGLLLSTLPETFSLLTDCATASEEQLPTLGYRTYSELISIAHEVLDEWGTFVSRLDKAVPPPAGCSWHLLNELARSHLRTHQDNLIRLQVRCEA
jgi:hypothetical protein